MIQYLIENRVDINIILYSVIKKISFFWAIEVKFYW